MRRRSMEEDLLDKPLLDFCSSLTRGPRPPHLRTVRWGEAIMVL